MNVSKILDTLKARLGPQASALLAVAVGAVVASLLAVPLAYHLSRTITVPLTGQKIQVDAGIDVKLVRMCGTPDVARHRDGARLISPKGKLWKPGTVLRVRFLEGSAEQRRFAFQEISRWSKVCNIRFKRVESGPAEIRVTFDPHDGAWSAIGRDCLDVPDDAPTMNLGFADQPGAVTHEAGHAIGFAHEQASPFARIRWDKARVYAYFSGPPNRWDPQEIYWNVLARYGAAEVLAGPWDRDSIMQYPVDPILTTDGKGIGWNTRISIGDAMQARAWYPFTGDRQRSPSPSVPSCSAPSMWIVPTEQRARLAALGS